jgi:hypothetical protein
MDERGGKVRGMGSAEWSRCCTGWRARSRERAAARGGADEGPRHSNPAEEMLTLLVTSEVVSGELY